MNLLRVGTIVALFVTPLVAAESAAISPREVIVLFNGKDLTNFYTWEPVHGRKIELHPPRP